MAQKGVGWPRLVWNDPDVRGMTQLGEGWHPRRTWGGPEGRWYRPALRRGGGKRRRRLLPPAACRSRSPPSSASRMRRWPAARTACAGGPCGRSTCRDSHFRGTWHANDQSNHSKTTTLPHAVSHTTTVEFRKRSKLAAALIDSGFKTKHLAVNISRCMQVPFAITRISFLCSY